MIFRSPFADVEIPDVSLADFVLEHAAERGDKTALIDGPTGRTVSHAEVADVVGRCAGGLASMGVHRGDIVALCSPNSPEYAIAFHAIAAAGAVCTTLNPLYTVDELAFQLEHSGARLLITSPDGLD